MISPGDEVTTKSGRVYVAQECSPCNCCEGCDADDDGGTCGEMLCNPDDTGGFNLIWKHKTEKTDEQNND